MGKTYVSDIITTHVVEQLERGENYLIGSEMNSGKNYWVRNVLLPYNIKNKKKTLILSHRTQTREQQINYLKEYSDSLERQFMGGMYHLKTYQQFQNMIHRKDPSIHWYDYIVCDEAHYFVSDSSFNARIELIFDFLNQNKDVVKIFMTGTYEGLNYLPWKNGLEILKEANYYNNNVKDLYRYEKNDTALSVAQGEIEKENKIMVFHSSVNTLEDFNIGNHKALYAGNRDSSLEFKQISEEQKFEVDVLNTTKLMTEATEIKDEKVQTIFIHGISDIDTFVQSTARVRTQKVNVYYKRVSKKSIQAKLRYLEKQLDYYYDYCELGETEFVKEYGIDVIDKSMKAFYLDTVMDPISNYEYTRLRVHQTGLAYLEYQHECYEFMGVYGFEAFFKEYFPNVEYIDLEQLKRENYIKLDIVENYVDKKIFKDQQRELVNVLCNKYGLRAKNGSRKVGMKTINAFFEENNISYKIESIQEKDESSEMYNKSYWILKRN